MNIKDEIARMIDVELVRIRNFHRARIDKRDMEIVRLQNILKRNGLGWKKAVTKRVARKSISI